MNLVEGEGASRNQKNVTKPDQKSYLRSHSVVEGGNMLQEACGGLFWSYFGESWGVLFFGGERRAA